MKFGASYDIFNGEEHFLPSLRTHRNEIDYINVVVQYKSNHGEEATELLYEAVNTAKQDGLVDEVIEYVPDLSLIPQANHLEKRNIGLAFARSAGVDYFMTLDADEYYLPEALKEAKRFILKNNILTTAAHSYLHIKRPIYRSKLPDNTCVCFFSKIEAHTKLVQGDFFPAFVDPARRIHGERDSFYMFMPDEIAMMHMNLVRTDGLASKLRNSSSASATEFMDKVKNMYQTWTFGDVLVFPNKPPMEIIQTDDYFGIDHLFTKA